MKDKSYWLRWAKAAAERAAKTFAQAVIAGIPVSVAIQEVQWIHVLGTAALAGVVSLLTSLAGLPEVEAFDDGE